jgi:probable rRNA maturation factor
MKFYFEDKTKKFKASSFKHIAASVFKKLRINDKIEIGLKITDNREVRKLNQKYRAVDETTDVLSFPIDTLDKKEKNEPQILGDIVISQQFAREHHEKMTKLFKHGLLHLLGFDHKKNKLRWQKAEAKIKNL